MVSASEHRTGAARPRALIRDDSERLAQARWEVSLLQALGGRFDEAFGVCKQALQRFDSHSLG